MKLLQHIPTHIVTGFLGAGKTTTILEWLAVKSDREHWAVLVNEFGEVGVDGALFAASGATVREVAGGCLCCVNGLPMRVALQSLIRKARPDRIFIEPTGLGHPAELGKVLSGPDFSPVLSLAASVAVVDVRRLSEPRVVSNLLFCEQLGMADFVIPNRFKSEPAAREALEGLFRAGRLGSPPPLLFGDRAGQWAQVKRFSGGRQSHATSVNKLALGPASTGEASAEVWQCALEDGRLWQRFSRDAGGMLTVGWLIDGTQTFDRRRLLAWVHGLGVLRIKAVVETDTGGLGLNGGEGAVSEVALQRVALSRFELITEVTSTDVGMLERGLLDCLMVPVSDAGR